MNIAYLDCFSGVSGNMLLGALLGVGLAETFLRDTLSGLPVSGYQLDIRKEKKSGLTAYKVQVTCDRKQPHRHLHHIKKILTDAELDAPVRDKSLAVFTHLARAEARVHGTTVDQVHFHEVGAMDALVDVVGTVAGFHQLHIETLICSPLPMPHGWVRCEHGEIPLPAPAVCELLRDVPVYGDTLDQELVTPTGAALVRELSDQFGPMPSMTLGSTGYGAGSMQRRDGRPNLLRLMIGSGLFTEETQQVEVIETHLDDWSPETWPYVSEQLMENGALDISLVPIQMKKGRPGFLIRVLSDPAHAQQLKAVLFRETSAIGLRFHTQQRLTLPRQRITVQTPWGPVQAKKIITANGPVITPEYEECRRLAKKNNVPIQHIYHEVLRCAKTP